MQRMYAKNVCKECMQRSLSSLVSKHLTLNFASFPLNLDVIIPRNIKRMAGENLLTVLSLYSRRR